MKRWPRIRLLIVLIALALIPAATLSFADRVRIAWTSYWEPRTEEEIVVESFEIELPPMQVLSIDVTSYDIPDLMLVPAEPEVEPEIGVERPL